MNATTSHRAVVLLLAGALLLTLSLGHALPCSGSERVPMAAQQGFKAGELLIRFRPGLHANRQVAVAILIQAGATQSGTIPALGVERWRVPVGREAGLAAALTGLSAVEYAERNAVVTAQLVPDDPF